jgi:isocitrate dehydrogenase kinase/phosphatase
LKHLDTTLATYKRRQIKHLKHGSETFAKTLKNTKKIIANIRNIQIKHLQYMRETYATPDNIYLQHTSEKQMKH